MKSLRLIIPILIVFLVSCEPSTGPDTDPKPNTENSITLEIVKPNTGSEFQKNEQVPCEIDISETNLADKVEWKFNNSNVECNEQKLSIPENLNAGDQTLKAYIDYQSYNLSDEVEITITKTPTAPNVEITLPQFDEFLYTESSNIYLKATASDVNGNIPSNTQISWKANGTQIATSSPNQEIKIEARPEYKNIVAEIKDRSDLIGRDTLKVGVYEKVISFVEEIDYKNSNDSELSIYLDTPISKEKHTVTLFKDIDLHDEPENKHYISNFSFSPNGRSVAYLNNSSCDQYKDGLFIANYDFSNPKEAFCNERGVQEFSWMPNGEEIMFISEEKLSRDDGGYIWADNLYKLDVNTGNTEKIDIKFCNKNETNIPCWSPHMGRPEINPISDNEIIIGLKKVYETELFEGSDTIVEDRAKTLTRVNINTGKITELWVDLPTIGAIRPSFTDLNLNKQWVAGFAETYDEHNTHADKRGVIFKADGSTGKLPQYITPIEENNVWEIFFLNNNAVCHKEGSALSNSDLTERLIKCRDTNGSYLYERDYSEMESISNITVYPQF